MSRLVELDATGPRKLDESDIDTEKGDIAVCQCGLSDDFPFCDGSHGQTESEGDGCYRYVEDDSHRKEVEHVEYVDGESEQIDSE